MFKVISIFSLLLFFSITSQAQKAYIQVKGEPNLEVYLNGTYKGTTSADLGGYIIENVTAGKNTIKIIKQGYAPYEESITVSAGEVLSYTVKPFAKHKVIVSETGNTQTADKQKSLQTGKLVIQSVPIEIKLTIPDIEGVDNSSKTKDQWIAESIPSGSYRIIFSFNNKTYEKTVEIEGNETTSVFANMLSGEITVKSSLDYKKARERQKTRAIQIMDSIGLVYKFKFNMTEPEFRAYNPEAAKTFGWDGGIRKKKDRDPGVFSYLVGISKKTVFSYMYLIKGEGNTDAELSRFLNEQLAYYKKQVPADFLRIGDNYFAIDVYPRTVTYKFCTKYECYPGKSGFVTIDFSEY